MSLWRKHCTSDWWIFVSIFISFPFSAFPYAVFVCFEKKSEMATKPTHLSCVWVSSYMYKLIGLFVISYTQFCKQQLKWFPLALTDMAAICKYCVVIGVAVWAIVLLSQQTDAQQWVMMLAIVQSLSACVTWLDSPINYLYTVPNIMMKRDTTDWLHQFQYCNTQCQTCLHTGHWYNYG